MICDGVVETRMDLYDASVEPWVRLMSVPVEGKLTSLDIGFVFGSEPATPRGGWVLLEDVTKSLEDARRPWDGRLPCYVDDAERRLVLSVEGSTQPALLFGGLLPEDPLEPWVGGVCADREDMTILGGLGTLVYSKGVNTELLNVHRGTEGVIMLNAVLARRRYYWKRCGVIAP